MDRPTLAEMYEMEGFSEGDLLMCTYLNNKPANQAYYTFTVGKVYKVCRDHYGRLNLYSDTKNSFTLFFLVKIAGNTKIKFENITKLTPKQRKTLKILYS